MAAELTVTRSRASELDRLYVEHIDGAVRLAYLLCGDPHLARDLAHDAFIRVASRLKRLTAPGSFRAYLNRTIINLTRDHFRRASVRRRHVQRTSNDEPAIELPDVVERDAMWSALKQLSSRQRAALVLRYYEDLSEREAADALDCSVPALKSLVRRGLMSLREEMGVDDG